MTQFQTFVGLDVGKFTVVVAGDELATPLEVPNDPVGFERLTLALDRAGIAKADALLVLEPTGGYEFPIWSALVAQGFQVRRVDAKQVRHFAKALGLRAKTDLLDAQLLADYARKFPDRGSELAPEKLRNIKALVARRIALIENRKGIRCRLKQDHSAMLTQYDQELEALLTKQIETLENSISKALEQDQELAEKSQNLRTIPGVGPVLTSMMLTHMPELGQTNDKQIAALAGVAPFAHDSGKTNGKRFVQAGRKALRNVLYQAALVATQHNPQFKEFATRLKQNGKPHKVIITAVARKLVVLANTIVRENRPWKQTV